MILIHWYDPFADDPTERFVSVRTWTEAIEKARELRRNGTPFNAFEITTDYSGENITECRDIRFNI